MNRTDGTSVLWWRMRAVAVVGAIVLAGCSSGGGDDDASDQRDSATTINAPDSTPAPDDDPEDPADDPAVEPAGEPVSHLPFDGEAPDGYRMVPADCEANAEAQAAEEEAGEYNYPSPIVFAVPEEWSPSGRGSGGSGGITGTDVDLNYRTVDSGDVEVGFEWDSRGPDGEVMDNNEPWTTFDYDYITDDETTVIEYENVATVEIEDQSVDIFYRDPSQAPDVLIDEQYKARVSTFDLPNSLFVPGGIDQYSLVFTITFDAETDETNQDAVEAIIASVNLPTCVWDDLLAFEEITRQADLNGDGEVKSMEEWQEELQAEMDAATPSGG